MPGCSNAVARHTRSGVQEQSGSFCSSWITRRSAAWSATRWSSDPWEGGKDCWKKYKICVTSVVSVLSYTTNPHTCQCQHSNKVGLHHLINIYCNSYRVKTSTYNVAAIKRAAWLQIFSHFCRIYANTCTIISTCTRTVAWAPPTGLFRILGAYCSGYYDEQLSCVEYLPAYIKGEESIVWR